MYIYKYVHVLYLSCNSRAALQRNSKLPGNILQKYNDISHL